MNKIMHHFAGALSATVLLAAPTARAQDVLASAGARFQNATWDIAFTIGEPVIATHAQAGTVLTQGFHQPEDDFSTVVAEMMDAQAEVLAFPNPARDEVTVQVSGIDGPVQLELFDALGRSVGSTQRFTERTVLDANALASGNYHLRLSTTSGYLTTIQLTIAH
jgi:hypothetical protein